MRNIYDVSEKQKDYFLNDVWGFTGERPYSPTHIRIVEDTDLDGFGIVFLEYNKGGQQYVFDNDGFYFQSVSKDDANRIINDIIGATFSTLVKKDGLLTLSGSNILPEHKFLNIKRRVETVMYS